MRLASLRRLAATSSAIHTATTTNLLVSWISRLPRPDSSNLSGKIEVRVDAGSFRAFGKGTGYATHKAFLALLVAVPSNH